MARHKIGDRVRIDCPPSAIHNFTGTIIRREEKPRWTLESIVEGGIFRCQPGYILKLDKVVHIDAGVIPCFPANMLKPLAPPADEAWWQAFKKRNFQPDPAIIMAREPEVMAWWPSP